MARRVLIIPDKFKGTLTAGQAAAAIARGWRRVGKTDKLTLLPMSDGGDGFGAVMSDLLGGQAQRVRTVDAARRPINARWWWVAHTRTAIIESATVIGLARLPAGKYHPFQLDTFGLGAVFHAARRRHPKQIIVGVGGSATNDGGFGLARALGGKFFDRDGREIETWTRLDKLESMLPPALFRKCRVIVAVDVKNRLLGARGATRVYGPQKGLRETDFARAERCLRRLARFCQHQTGRDIAGLPGSGAAGGLGFGLLAFCGAEARAGYELFADAARLKQRLGMTDLVITAEGALDRSSVMGKGVGEVAGRCAQLDIPCIGLAGKVIRPLPKANWFIHLDGLTDHFPSAQALKAPARCLAEVAAHAASVVSA